MQAKMNKWSCWITETRPDKLQRIYEGLLSDSGFCVLNSVKHSFSPYGFTALYLLSESHLAIHTFPERGKTYVELSSCVDGPFHRFMKMHKCEKTKGDTDDLS